ncbi:GH3 auxin-responsive promoter family protein [Nonomuraea sp. NPDC048892]|uniref:GH3 auxin-responsive promoter family protein n=1 Tax=Nonomuraea sp. NPDC048892 TaxID=3154624 RepID=UPI0033D056B1
MTTERSFASSAGNATGDAGAAAVRAEAYRRRVLLESGKALASLDDPRAAQSSVLAELLATNGGTAFGREHGLPAVRDAAGYRRATPIRGHEEFRPWLERVHAGERQVLTSEEPTAFFASSGTTGGEKSIPVTAGFLRRCFLPFYFAGFAQLVRHHPDLPARDDAVLNLWQDPHSPTGRTSDGRPHLGPSQLDFAKAGEDLAVGLGNRAPWSRLPAELGGAGPWERAYLRLRMAAEHDVRGIIAVNPAIAAALPHQLREWWPRMVEEIRNGTVGGIPLRPPAPGRAAELERVAARRGTLRPADLWPRLELLLTWNTYVSRLYLPALREEYGAGLRIRPAPIGSSEGPLAVPLAGRSSGGALMVSGCLYEFIPAGDRIEPWSDTLEPHELQEGEEYHVVVSHVGGLYRCAVRDIVRVVGFAGATPIVEYSCRDGRVSEAGERVRESHVLRAVAAAGETTGLPVQQVMYRARPNAGPPGHQTADTSAGPPQPEAAAFAGLPRHEAAVAFTAPPADLTPFRDTLDQALCREEPGYAAARRSGALAAPLVHAVPVEAFWREWRRRVEEGERPTRVKDRVFRDDPAAWQRVLSFAGGRR